ncbi:CRE-IFG-1 protein [Caenorhabditis remanei]|uniref:CRE-IFG-1 protein n=1 Tax=Caenorhabditis remanei TaxID=31234 RepID=E3LGR7_CAERE|nr:CRE-IFG-1 protein [Caenorhabditis remanei]
MSNAVSRGPGRGKPNHDHNGGPMPDQSQAFVMPFINQPNQQTYPARIPHHQMPPQTYQNHYMGQHQPHQYQYQPQQQPPQMQPQQYGAYPRQDYGQQQMYNNQQYPYQPQQPVYQSDTVTYPPTQAAMTTPMQQEPKRQRKLLEIVDPTTKKPVDVTPHHVPAPVVPVPVVPVTQEDEIKKEHINREFLEQVKKGLSSNVASDDGHQASQPHVPVPRHDGHQATQAHVPVPRHDGHQAAQAHVPVPGLPNFSVPPPNIVHQSPPAVTVQQTAPSAPKTPEAPAKVETPTPQADHITPISSPQASETATTTPGSGTAEAALTSEARVTPTLLKEESKEEFDDDKFDENERIDTPDMTDSQIEKTPEELAEEEAQKEAEDNEKKRLKEESLETRVDQLIESGDANVTNGTFGRAFMVTIREIEKLFCRTPCPLSPSQLADFGLDIKTMRVADKKPNFTPNWVPNNKGNRQQNPYRGRTTTDGTGRGAQQQRDRGGHNKRPPPVRQSIERVQRVTLQSSKDAWKPDRQKGSENIPEDEAAVKEVCKKVRALMNKVTPTSQGPLTEEFISYKVSSNDNQLAQVVGIIFDKAVEEPKFCALYAEMCKSQVDHELREHKSKSAFRNTILTRTQAFFQDKRDIDADKLAVIEKEEDPVKREALLAEEKQKFRRRKFGVMAFIGYLFKNALLSTKIIHACTFELFTSILPKKIDDVDQKLRKEDIDEESVHCGLQLIETVGNVLDKPTSPFLDQWFQKLDIAKPFCSNKIRFMIMNLIELRKDKWIPRKSTESGPKKLDEIHKDIRQEKIENEKARDQYDRDRDRRHGGGVRPNSNSLRKQAPPTRNSLERNNRGQHPDQKRAAAAANTKLASSSVQPKNISLSAVDNSTLGKTKKEWHSGASGGGNTSESAAAPGPPKSAWGRRDSNDQRKKSNVDDKQSALAAAEKIGAMSISARRSTSQTSIPDKVDEEPTEEEMEGRMKIMSRIKSDIQEVIEGASTKEELVADIGSYIGKPNFGNASLPVFYEMVIRAVSEKNLKDNERKLLACILRMSLTSKVEKQAFIDGVTRFCKFAIDTELYQDFPHLWSYTAEVLMHTIHADPKLIGEISVESINLAEMKSVFLAAKMEGKKKFSLFVLVLKEWTDAELTETGKVEALSWDLQDLPYREEMEKDGLRKEMDEVTASNGKTLSSLLYSN